MHAMTSPIRRAALFTVAVSALALGTAFASELWGGLVPCALCLVERWPYRVAIGLGVLGLILPPRLGHAVLALAALVLLGGAGIGFVHVGVEQGWWPSPLPECAAPRLSGNTIEERLARLPSRPAKPCDDPTYPVAWIPVSMAAMNMMYGLAAGGLLLAAAATMRERPR